MYLTVLRSQEVSAKLTRVSYHQAVVLSQRGQWEDQQGTFCMRSKGDIM